VDVDYREDEICSVPESVHVLVPALGLWWLLSISSVIPALPGGFVDRDLY
jgi:hypothetical protein